MNSNFEVGVIWAVNGNQVTIKMNSITSDFTYFYNGEEYEGIRNGGYLSITRGHIDIICQIESEEIKDNYQKESKNKYTENERYEKFVYARCIGFFENEKFNFGIKYSPIIYNTVKIINNQLIESLLSPKKEKNEIEFVIGKDLQYGLKIDLPWNKIFNTHIGIFGNTGSGKSNTLTNLYKILLNHKKLNVKKSNFVFIDFNGEYTGDKVLCDSKVTYKLNTRQDDEGDKFPIKSDSFWDEEVLSILFHATEKTQKPFLKNLIKGRNKYISNKNSLENYLKKIYIRCLETLNPKKEFVEILIRTLKLMDYDDIFLKELQWHSQNQIFYSGKTYYNEGKVDESVYKYVEEIVKIIKIENIDQFTELEIRANLDLIRGLLLNNVQYDNINPLLSRIESISVSLKKIINIVEKNNSNKNNLEIISLRNCNQEIKKMFPILLAKEYFKEHKEQNKNEVKKLFI